MVRIYHGTSIESLGKIIEEGIVPKSISNNVEHWKTLPSNSDVVYLTSIYAPYFAHRADSKNCVLIEVEIPEQNYHLLLPDEDFLEQKFRHLKPDLTIEERTFYFRDNLEKYRSHWQTSLSELGNCAYQGCIPKEFISRITCWSSTEMEIISGQYNGIWGISIEESTKNFQKFELLTQIFAKREVDYSHLAKLIVAQEPWANWNKNEIEQYLISDSLKIVLMPEKC